jgi:hypothetical protein
MIPSFFLSIFYSIASMFLSLFPTADTAALSTIDTSVSTASGYFSAVSSFLPITTLLIILAIFLSIEGFILLIKFINWAIRKIPTIS